MVLLAVTWICKSGRASLAGLLALLGVIQWFDLMRRSKLFCYSVIYAFDAVWKDWTERELPADACQELLTSICLSAFWGVDMTLPFLPFIAATDASDEFGRLHFGFDH